MRTNEIIGNTNTGNIDILISRDRMAKRLRIKHGTGEN